MLSAANKVRPLPPKTSVEEEYDEDDDEAIKIDSILPSLLEQMDPAEDTACLEEAMQGIKRLEKLRTQQQTDAHDAIKKLSRELDAAKRAAADVDAASDAMKIENDARIAQLEQEKYAIGKKMHDDEKSVANLDARKRELLAQLEELTANEEAEAARPPDESELKLSIYQNLGLELVYEDGKVARCHVLSTTKQDITTLEMTDVKYSNFFYANVLWDMCS
ncbi:Spc24 subunit of Ndc80-domain-containing protein [Obelidium mucronatum]|nr:Spc24 subunit of Ndc80-domain-containing protein [Obelidium mucronatum]